MTEPYRCVMLDPPWKDRGGGCGKITRGAQRHYPLLSVPEITRVIAESDAFRMVGLDAHMWMWIIAGRLEEGLQVMADLEFRYVSNIVWVKPSYGLGRYMRHQHEICLFGTRGRAMMPSDRAVPSIVQAPKGRHSRKPDEAYRAIERVSPGPRLSMFDREQRAGWDVWGNEVGSCE